MYTLFTDTDTDITPEVAKQYGFKLISMPYSIDGVTYFPYEDSDTFDFAPYYDLLRTGVIPTTSAISKEKYREYFKPEFENGNDILYVSFSAAMSATFGPMQEVVDELLREFPERSFRRIDTKAITVLSYVMIREIGDMYLAGKSVDEICEWAEKEVPHFALYFFADDLKFFHRSGRVGGLTATMGTMLGIRPIIHINDEGKMVSIGKERGRANAIKRLVRSVEELGDDITSHYIGIAHTGAPDMANELVDLLKEKFGKDLDVIVVNCNPTAGAHCGPNGMGVAFHAKHR